MNFLEGRFCKMKKKMNFGLVLFFSLVLGFSTISCMSYPPTSASYSLPDLVGVWEGSYTANQGETGLTLTVWEENGNYRATFYFYNLPGKTNAEEGSYYMTVTSNHSTRLYNLVGTEWIKQPSGWGFVNLEGIVHGNVFTGTVLRGRGSIGNFSFRVTRK
jgi:hypothetical protein